jgi:hypothetical protein
MALENGQRALSIFLALVRASPGQCLKCDMLCAFNKQQTRLACVADILARID